MYIYYHNAGDVGLKFLLSDGNFCEIMKKCHSKKFRIADEHFVYCIYKFRFLIGMFAESSMQYLLSVIVLKRNGEENGERKRRGSGAAERWGRACI